MRRSLVLIGGSILLASAVITGCHKGSGGNGPQNALHTVFTNNLAAAEQSFFVDALAGGTITGSDGTQVTFIANAFRTQGGGAVSGQVTVKLVEALTVGKMILINKQTVGSDNGVLKPLTSGGQFRLTAFQNGQPLKLVPGGSFVLVPANNPDPQMELFSGTVDADGTILWDPFAQGQLNADSMGYTFPNDSLGWINCDYFMNWGVPLTTITVTVPTDHNDQNTFVWAVFPSINSLTNAPQYDANASTFATGPNYSAPIGENVIIVSLALINGVYYSSFTPTTLVANHNEVISYQATTLAQFNADCMAL